MEERESLKRFKNRQFVFFRVLCGSLVALFKIVSDLYDFNKIFSIMFHAF